MIITDMNETYPADLDVILKTEGITDTVVRISMKDVEGRNMYCDDEAFRTIRERLSATDDPAAGIHFIDTGNYHYMSRIYTSFLGSGYDLLLIDNHTDMQEASFGGLLSCGSWAREVLEKDENLRSLTVIGPRKFEEGGEEMPVCLGSGTLYARVYKGLYKSEDDVPLYISLDKDVMRTSECITNWDQGDLSMDELRELIMELTKGRRVIGSDICGGISESDPGYDGRACGLNTETDIELVRILKEIMEV